MNTGTHECLLCENTVFSNFRICKCCDPKTLKKDTARNIFFEYLSYSLIGILAHLFIQSQDPSPTGLLSVFLPPIHFAVFFGLIITAFNGFKFVGLSVIGKDGVIDRPAYDNISHFSGMKKASETGKTREENKEKLLDSIDDIEYYISKIKRARSTKSILTLTNEAREEIAISKAIMKGCQAKMLKAELTASIELLEDTIEQAENKLVISMNDNNQTP